MQTPSGTQHLLLLLLHLPLCLLLLSSLNGSTAAAPSGGRRRLGFQLIHRDSVHSPLYPGNLTAYEFLERRVNFSKAHVQQISLRARGRNGVVPDDITPIIEHVPGGFEYLVRMYIGSKSMFQFVLLDTGSDLIWVQCEPYVDSHFNQNQPHYVIGESETLYYIPCSDRKMCLRHYTCDAQKRCIAKVSYADGGWAKGYMAMEQISFTDEDGDLFIIPNITFGCMNSAKENTFGTTKLAGILGMGLGEQSLPSQLAYDKALASQFTYCLVPSSIDEESYLEFTDDHKFRDDEESTTLSLVWNPHLTNHYYVNLTGLSCDAVRLNVGKSTFEINKNNGLGGCLIDTGSASTHIIEPAFRILETFIDKYFEFAGSERLHGFLLEICYRLYGAVKPLPPLTFHFGTKSLFLDELWLKFRNGTDTIACLQVIPSKDMTVIGANAMYNKRFVFDTKKSTVAFAKENCAEEG